jgi:Fe-S-cluster-containing dehydrogenase component
MSGAGFLVGLHRCVGCGSCVLACRIENGRTEEQAWRRVLPLNLRRHPGGPTYFLSVACHHCDEPACLRGCPSRAYEQRADGVVVHHEDRCLGCRYCEMTCPFGTPKYDDERGIVSKCHLCAQRLDQRLAPACVAACPTEALRCLMPDATPNTATPTTETLPHVASDATPSAVTRTDVPGFVDPAGCRPNIRFTPPRGARRAALFAALEEAMRR